MTFRTLCDIPRRLEAENRKPDQLLHKSQGSWRPISTVDFVARLRDVALGLRAAGIRPGDRVALLSENRPEWTTTDYAILCAGAVTVPIYTTLLPDQIEFILRDSGARAVVVSTADQVAKILAIRPRLPELAEVVVFDAPSPLPAGVRAWGEVAATGAAARARDPRAADVLDGAVPGDLASIIYTSGTTGRPKGVMLTHANFVHNVAASCDSIPFRADDVCLSILPLSHVYERMVEYCYLHRGATIAYAESIDAVATALVEVRPTIACGVPRLIEKMHLRIIDAGSALPAPRRLIFNWALAVARAVGSLPRASRRPGWFLETQRRLADRLVYSAIRARQGGRIRFFVTGSAPVAREVLELLYGMGIIVLEGYGLTESSPVIAVNRLESICFGSVGPPIPGMDVRIAEDGEILARGPSVMAGYFHDEAATREAIVDGWLLTGDIGRLDEHGCLVITDRKKEVLKTSGGKMIAPQPIENLLRADRFVSQAVVIGERRNFVSALIVPSADQIRSYCVLKGIPGDDLRELLRHPRILDLFERRIARINEGLARYEQVRRFCLLEREFTVEAGEITPTLKPRRKVIEEHYRDRIEGMYAPGPHGPARPAKS
ncbi:MAG TPA: long-chain fatty acid--CoA ligase [Patescibacteria group bacterium]|nr:long-chain fatty acid--CoA ligase [Patescibacteria group bacterium]